MEAGGHYYTVYYTSLAVGYTQELAYQHAVLAQMPDQVSWMDASHMQQSEARIAGNIRNCWSSNREIDLNGNCRVVSTQDRARIQAGPHSLVPNHSNSEIKSSSFQRRFTINRLMDESPASLKFGILLHRLGDSYAHSRMDDDKKMYGISSNSLFTFSNLGESAGHLFDMHDPDYPFLRPKNIFLPYVQQLYNVLYNKLHEKQNLKYKRPNYNSASLSQVKFVFENIFQKLIQRKKQFGETHQRTVCSRGGVCVKVPIQADNERMASWFISELRIAMGNFKDVKIEAYAPEKQQLKSLREFLNGHRELNHLNINSTNLNEAINEMIPGGPDSLIPEPGKSIRERAYDYVKETEFMRGMTNEIQKLTRPPGFP